MGERSVVREPVPIAHGERAFDEDGQRNQQHRQRDTDDCRNTGLVASGARATGSRCLPKAEPLDGGALGARRRHHERHDERELHAGQHGRGGEVGALCRIAPDLGLERRLSRAADHKDHSERREAEEEHDRGCGPQRWLEVREGHFAPYGAPCRTEYSRRFLQTYVEHRPVPADHTHDDGDVEDDVRDEDRPDGLVEVHPPAVESES